MPTKKTSSKKPAKAKAAPEPSYESKVRTKYALVREVKDENTTYARALEIRAILDGPLANIPVLSREELNRLGA